MFFSVTSHLSFHNRSAVKDEKPRLPVPFVELMSLLGLSKCPHLKESVRGTGHRQLPSCDPPRLVSPPPSPPPPPPQLPPFFQTTNHRIPSLGPFSPYSSSPLSPRARRLPFEAFFTFSAALNFPRRFGKGRVAFISHSPPLTICVSFPSFSYTRSARSFWSPLRLSWCSGGCTSCSCKYFDAPSCLASQEPPLTNRADGF